MIKRQNRLNTFRTIPIPCICCFVTSKSHTIMMIHVFTINTFHMRPDLLNVPSTDRAFARQIHDFLCINRFVIACSQEDGVFLTWVSSKSITWYNIVNQLLNTGSINHSYSHGLADNTANSKFTCRMIYFQVTFTCLRRYTQTNDDNDYVAVVSTLTIKISVGIALPPLCVPTIAKKNGAKYARRYNLLLDPLWSGPGQGTTWRFYR